MVTHLAISIIHDGTILDIQDIFQALLLYYDFAEPNLSPLVCLQCLWPCSLRTIRRESEGHGGHLFMPPPRTYRLTNACIRNQPNLELYWGSILSI